MGCVSVYINQARRSWHKTVLYHHSNKEWTRFDRSTSVDAWRYHLVIALFFVIFEWLRTCMTAGVARWSLAYVAACDIRDGTPNSSCCCCCCCCLS
jgi:hypothetical protein